MTQERELSRPSNAQTAALDLDMAPGRDSQSARLAAPEHPIVSGLIQRKAERDANGVAAGADAAIATAAASSGSPLPGPVQRKFESSLGADLSGVRVHTGGESQAAASAVGAKAYTTDQDIHFGAGHYDPSGGGGEHLLAHEVAHTVQQRGGSPARQNKLEVSAPQDAAEVEADRAADAMVSGGEASISGFGGVQRQVFRDANPNPGAAPSPGPTPASTSAAPHTDDKAWATDARTKVEALQSAVTAANSRLVADATGAITSFQAAYDTCSQFESEFNAAKSNFISNVKEAIEKQKEFEEMLAQTFEIALKAGSLGGSEFVEVVEQSKGVMDSITGVMEKVGTVATLMGAPKEKAAPASTSPENAAPAAIDWKNMLDQVLNTLKSYNQQNSGLASIASSCVTSDHWLTSVVEGSGPKNAQQSSDGVAASKLATGSDQAIAGLAGIGKRLAPPAQAFASGIKSDLTQRGLGQPRTIEQNIAIRWLSGQTTAANGVTTSGYGGRGSSDIHAARDYLEKLGVLGKSSRSGVDAGMWDTDVDDDMIVARSRVETQAMKLVGTTAEWQGGKLNGNVAAGKVVADGEMWKATGKAQVQNAPTGAGLTEAGGGNVRIDSYTIAPISSEASQASTAARSDLLHDLVTLSVSSAGQMGGGASGLPTGPSIGPAPSGGGGGE